MNRFSRAGCNKLTHHTGSMLSLFSGALLSTAVITTAVLAIVLLGASPAAHAIVIRHDVEDSQYQTEASEYPELVSFMGEYQGDTVVMGSGTYIGDGWVVTAAHVANYLAEGSRAQVAGMGVSVLKVFRHPGWQSEQAANDIALVKIQTLPGHVMPMKLYSGEDEKGKVLTFVGRGDTGDGRKGVTSGDAVLRQASNQVTDAKGQWLSFVFDRGDTALPLEGISGPGDSGGPAFLQVGNQRYLIGVSAWQDSASTDWQEGRYGVVEYYSRISHHLGWLQATMEQAKGLAFITGLK